MSSFAFSQSQSLQRTTAAVALPPFWLNPDSMTTSTPSQRPIKPCVLISGPNFVKVYKSIEKKIRTSFLLHYEVTEEVLETQILQELESIPGQHPDIFRNLGPTEKEIVLLSIGRKCVRNNSAKKGSIYQLVFFTQPSPSKPSHTHKIRRLSEGNVDVKKRLQKREYNDEMHESTGQLTTLHEGRVDMMGAFGPDQSAPYSMASMNKNGLDWMSVNRMSSREETQNELVKARHRFDMRKAMQRDQGGPSGMSTNFMHHNTEP